MLVVDAQVFLRRKAILLEVTIEGVCASLLVMLAMSGSFNRMMSDDVVVAVHDIIAMLHVSPSAYFYRSQFPPFSLPFSFVARSSEADRQHLSLSVSLYVSLSLSVAGSVPFRRRRSSAT